MSKRKSSDGEVGALATETLEEFAAPLRPRERRPCVGLPVQYHTAQGPVPAVLARQSLTDPSLWDVMAFLPGAFTLRNYPAVAQADEPRPGIWTFLPE